MRLYKIVGIAVLLIIMISALCFIYTRNSSDVNANDAIASKSTYPDDNDKLLPDSPKYLSAEDIKNIMRETDFEVKEINSRLDNEFYKDYYDRDILRFRYFSCGVEQESLSIYRLYYDQQGKLIYADIAHYRGALYSIYFYGDELLHVETGPFSEGGLFINGGMENVRDVIEKEPGYAFVLEDSSLCLEHAYK